MFRTLRSGAGVFSLSRLPLRIQSQHYQNAVPVQRVRMRRLVTARSVMTGVFATFVMYHVFSQTVFTRLDRLAEEIEKNLDEESKNEIAESNEPIFIPFPGTIKQIKPRPYKGSDPEWQEFIKFSKSPALGKSVRDELASIIKHACERSPLVIMRCGKDIKLRRYWLDVDFPTSPPPEFERSGIEITDDYIAWTTMPVDSLTVFRIRQALWPSALTQSLWTWTKVLITGRTGGTGLDRRLFPPIQGPPPPQSAPDIKKPQAGIDKSDISKAGLTPGRSLNAEELAQLREKTNQKLAEANQTLKELQQKESNALAVTKSGVTDSQSEKEDPFTGIRSNIATAYMAFRAKLAQTWRFAPSYPPRGSIIVSGLVELDTPRAWLVIDVRAAWDPKTKAYDPRNMHLSLRRLQLKKQGPLGGR